MLFCLQSKEVILYSYCPVGLLEIRYFSAIMLASSKREGAYSRGGLFKGGGLFERGDLFED